MEARESPRLIAPYHGYWPVEARTVEPRFGGDEALRTFVDAAHGKGIRVLLDLINNQVHEEHTYVREHPEWFRQGCVCGITPGCGWSERPLDCLFAPYLPDINWEHPDARQRFIADALYWVEAFDIDGFRVDAVKHVETMAIYNLRAALGQRFEQGGHRIIMLGETAVSANDSFSGLCGIEFPDGYAWIDAYTGTNALDGQFDFPSHHRWSSFITEGGSLRSVEEAMAAAERRYVNNQLNVQFLGSHDTPRVASRVGRAPGVHCRFDDACDSSLPTVERSADVYRRLRILWGLLYTAPSIPLLYYGGEAALPGGNDPDNRRPLRWTDLPAGDLRDGLSDDQGHHLDFMVELGQARSRLVPLRTRERTPLVVDDHNLVFARRGPASWVLVVAQTRAGAVVEIPRRDWMGGTPRLRALVGDAVATSTPQGWSIQAGASGITLLVPEEAP